MTTTEAPAPSSVIVEKLTKQHGDKLGVHESFQVALRGGAVDRPQPGAVFAVLGAVGRKMQQSLGEDALDRRMAEVNVILNRKGLHLFDFSPTKVGYTMALTQRRALVFNYTGRRFVNQSDLRGLRIVPVNHRDGSVTLLFCEGRQCAAMTCWDDDHALAHFIATFARLQRSPAA